VSPAPSEVPAPTPGERTDFDFWRLQATTARRFFGVTEGSLLGREPPPEVLSKDFGLLVERNFGL
jgi:hypothetical protein